MSNRPLIYAPFIFLFIAVFFIGGAILFALIQIGIISYAFDKVGVPAQYMFGFLFITIIGAFINIPIMRVPQIEVHPPQVVSYYGFKHVVPQTMRPAETIIAVNVGGAVVPTFLSVYLLSIMANPWPTVLATAALVLIVNRIARPIPGLGIAVPTLIPPVFAAAAAILISSHNIAATAYICGSMGTLIGADILSMRKIKKLHAPIVSIGGAGTFDGIFLSGVLAVLLATF